MLMRIGIPSTLVALASGIYLATTLGFWTLGWVKLAVPVLVLVAVAGAIISPRRNRIRAAIATGSGPLPSDLTRQLGHALLLGSLRFRTVMLSALVFVMTTKLAGPADTVALALSTVVGAAFAVVPQRDR
jgi:hypothetical protein